jgi:hypothetical protein
MPLADRATGYIGRASVWLHPLDKGPSDVEIAQDDIDPLDKDHQT